MGTGGVAATFCYGKLTVRKLYQRPENHSVSVHSFFWRILTVLFPCSQTQSERDELYNKFVKAIHEVQQKSNFKNLLLEKKLGALADTLEKKVYSYRDNTVIQFHDHG